MLDKTSILNALDLKREVVPCPEWGGDVTIQEMNALDRDRLRQEIFTQEGEIDTVNQAAKVLVRCIVGADGGRLFSDSDATSLGQKSAVVIQRLFAVAQKLNKIAVDDDEIKNSAPGLNESLPSDSV